MNRIKGFELLLASGLCLAACAEKHGADAGGLPPPGGAPVRNAADYDADGNYIGPGSQADLRQFAGSDKVYFEFDSSALDNADRDTLGRQATWLAKNGTVPVVIEGHCDERGTREYNLALGERRANATKNYLIALGISASRMSIVSYGKERPEAPGSDEASWARNRRAVTLVIRKN